MNIMIVGCGKIGQSLAERLVNENHSVTVVDNNEEVVRDLGNRLDVYTFVGNGASNRTLEDAGIKNTDLLIAVAQSDEVNMLCCLTAHKLGVAHTAARVRTPVYMEQLNFLKEDLGLSLTINPELSAAREMARIIRMPSAAHVDTFANGRAEMVSLRITSANPFSGMQLASLQSMSWKVLFCAVDRDGDVVIPDGSFTLRAGDTVYVAGTMENIMKMFRRMNISTESAKRVMIAGGGRIAYYLARNLLKEKGIGVTIIERDKARAEEIGSYLHESSVQRGGIGQRILRFGTNLEIINGDATDHEILQEAGLNKCNAFVALTGIDEGNLLSSMYAAYQGVPKVITKVNKQSVAALIRDERMDSVISPVDITANRVVAYVRSLANASTGGGNIETMYGIAGGQAEVLEFRAGRDSGVLRIQLKDLRLKPGILIACIARGTRVIIPGGADYIESGDHVMVVTKDQRVTRLTDILQER